MKKRMNPCPPSIFAMALLLAATCLPAAAEEPSPLDKRFDFNFEGGTIGHLIPQLEMALPNLNIVVMGGEFTRSHPLPPLQLKQANCREILAVFREISDILQAADITHNTIIIREPINARHEGRNEGCLFLHPLAPLLETYTFKDILMFLHEAYMIMHAEAPDFSFHDETSMLMAPVTARQLDIAQRAIKSLESAAEQKRENLTDELLVAQTSNKKLLEERLGFQQKIASLEIELAIARKSQKAAAAKESAGAE